MTEYVDRDKIEEVENEIKRLMKEGIPGLLKDKDLLRIRDKVLRETKIKIGINRLRELKDQVIKEKEADHKKEIESINERCEEAKLKSDSDIEVERAKTDNAYKELSKVKMELEIKKAESTTSKEISGQINEKIEEISETIPARVLEMNTEVRGENEWLKKRHDEDEIKYKNLEQTFDDYVKKSLEEIGNKDKLHLADDAKIKKQSKIIIYLVVALVYVAYFLSVYAVFKFPPFTIVSASTVIGLSLIVAVVIGTIMLFDVSAEPVVAMGILVVVAVLAIYIYVIQGSPLFGWSRTTEIAVYWVFSILPIVAYYWIRVQVRSPILKSIRGEKRHRVAH